MSFAAQSIPGRVVSPELRLIAGINQRKRAEELYLLGALFIAIQIIDGLLTFHGVSLRGTSVEGNHLLKHLMDYIGVGSALIIVKSIAALCTMIVCVAGTKISWVKPALISLIGIYLALAVAPWSYLLLVL